MFSSDKWLSATDTGFYPETIGQSLRLDGDARLSHSHQTAPTLQTKATVSFWIKLHDNNDRNIVLHTGVGTSNNTHMTLALGASNSYEGIVIGQYSRNLYIGSTSTPKQRDFTNFYHFFMKFDSTSSTASERAIKLYINGDEITDGTFTQMGQGDLFPLTAQTNTIYIGGHTPPYNYFTSGNIAELNVIDGQALDTTDFGESKNGVWIPKAYTGTYGNNGFRLTFEGSGTATTTDGTTAQTNIGDDQSGNGNNFAVYSSSVGSHDFSLDSPTNNFAVLNPLAKSSSITLSEGNLKWSSGSHNYQGTTATIAVPTSGKWYFECLVVTAGASTSHDFGIGLVSNSDDSAMGTQVNNNTFNNGAMFVSRGDTGSRVMVDGVSLGGSNTLSVGNGGIMQCAFDADSGKIWFGEDNNWYDASPLYGTNTTANAPSAGANEIATIDANHEYIVQFNGYTNQYVTVANFGQDSSFAGNKTSGSANGSDANGIGDFYYDPPSGGFLALCSSNLPDTTLSPAQTEQADDYFITTTYSGDSNNSTQISTGFQPDWVWIKNRTEGASEGSGEHMLYDSSRGVNDDLNSDNLSAEDTNTNGLQEFGSTFFRPGSLTRTNETGDTYVAWNWKATGGTLSTNTVGGITSNTQASVESGFSIVTYTGTGANSTDITIGHGLTNLTPRVVIVKNRSDNNTRWQFYHEDLSVDATYTKKNLVFDDASGESGYASQIKAVSSTTFTVRDTDANGNATVNKSGSNYVAYVFAEIAGFSRFGSYTGGGSVFPYVHLGFKPALLIIKSKASSTNGWYIYDNKRENYGTLVDAQLYVNITNAEDNGNRDLDFLSNGFKPRLTDTNVNGSGTEYIYMAFAAQPFKFSTAK